MSSEFQLIDDLAAIFRGKHSAVQTGIGDDCAVLEVDGATLLLTIDAFVEDVHFRREFASPRVLGSRAAAAALSDIAAMGGEATALLVTAALGPAWSPADAREIATGIAARASAAGAAVIGGDTTASPGPLFVDIAVLGRIPPGGHAVRRAGAQVGDVLAVTGTPGEAGLGLRHLLGQLQGELTLSPDEAERVVARHLDPTPRLREGRLLAGCAEVHAMIDISDGLGQDAGHLARAAGLGVMLDIDSLPCDPALVGLRTRALKEWTAAALGGGEDYELALALAPAAIAEISARLLDETGTRLTVVGRFEPSGPDGPSVRLRDGTRVDGLGWEHLGQDGKKKDVL